MNYSGPYERIDDSPRFDGRVRESHEVRYRYAASIIGPEDTVLDAACGTGYGKRLMVPFGKYIGVDREDLCGNIVADLNTWKPDFEFDVLVSFETLEHLRDYKNLIDIAHMAKRAIVLSTPIVPTVGGNIYHVQDFTAEQITKELLIDGWQLIDYQVQAGEYGIWTLQRV